MKRIATTEIKNTESYTFYNFKTKETVKVSFSYGVNDIVKLHEDRLVKGVVALTSTVTFPSEKMKAHVWETYQMKVRFC